jgi:hypothetical protein
MANNRAEDVAHTLQINAGTVKSWASREGWTEQRNFNNADNVAEIIETKKIKLTQLSDLLLDNIIKAIKRDAGPDGFKKADMGMYTNLLSQLDKLSRLSLGMPTSISEERGKKVNVTLPFDTNMLSDTKQVKMNDPFANKELDKTINDALTEPAEAESTDSGTADPSNSKSDS